MTELLREINWSPLWISLKTGLAATVIAFFLGIFCARKIMKLKPGARAVLDGILTLPLVLPPTVAGFFLLLIFSLKRPFGSFLLDNFDIKIVQTWKGCVIAAAVIAFPLMYPFVLVIIFLFNLVKADMMFNLSIMMDCKLENIKVFAFLLRLVIIVRL